MEPVLILRLCCLGFVAVALSACSPSNRQECMEAASAKPTNAGVQLAARECHKRFPLTPDPSAQLDPSTAAPDPAEIERNLALIQQRSAAPEAKPDAAWLAFVKSWLQDASIKAAIPVLIVIALLCGVYEVWRGWRK